MIVDSLDPGRDAATDEYTDDLFKAAPMLRRRCLTAIRAANLNLGGSVDMARNAVAIAELAVQKQTQTLLMPVSARRELNDLPDDIWTRIGIEFYKDAADAVFKALVEYQLGCADTYQRAPGV